ncbi:7-dehydrocholesterol reductase, isoform CRA_c [Mus musculus]|nr:7-dehydrocholesterol reductase, isoform CRA_c [Mus musculus]
MASKSQHNAPKVKSPNGKAGSQGQWGRAWGCKQV